MSRAVRLSIYRLSLVVGWLIVMAWASGAPDLHNNAHDNGNSIVQSAVFVQ